MVSKSDKKPYKSVCSDLYVDAANHLAELICQKKFHDEETGKLPEKFWRLPKWKNLYVREITQAKNLLKKYDERAVVAAMGDYEARFIRSLRNKNLIKIIEKHQGKIKETTFEESEKKEVTHRKKKHKPSLKDLL